MGRKNWLLSKNAKGARTNEICQSFIMNAEVNSLRPWKYLERLLAEIKELEEPIEEGGGLSTLVRGSTRIFVPKNSNTTSKKKPECYSI